MTRFALWFVSVLALVGAPLTRADSERQGSSRQSARSTIAPRSFGPAFTLEGSLTGSRLRDRSALEPRAAISVSVDVRRRGSPGPYRYLLAKGVAGCIVAASYALYTGPAGDLIFYVSQNDGLSYARSADAGSAIWDGRRHRAVGTYDGTAVHLYVDGREIGAGTRLTGPIGYGLVGGNDIFFGRIGTCPDTRFNGSISNLSIWNRALNLREIASAYSYQVRRDRSSKHSRTGSGGA